MREVRSDICYHAGQAYLAYWAVSGNFCSQQKTHRMESRLTNVVFVIMQLIWALTWGITRCQNPGQFLQPGSKKPGKRVNGASQRANSCLLSLFTISSSSPFLFFSQNREKILQECVGPEALGRAGLGYQLQLDSTSPLWKGYSDININISTWFSVFGGIYDHHLLVIRNKGSQPPPDLQFFEHCSKSLWPLRFEHHVANFFDGFLKKRVNVCRDKIRQNYA